MTRLSRLAGLAAFGIVAMACGGDSGGGGTANKGDLLIGVDLPLSGAEASQGVPTLNGVKFAVSQKGPIEGYTIKVKSLDDVVNGVHDAQKGAQNVSQLIDDNKVVGMIGPFNSSVARAEIPKANAAHLSMISPANTNQCLTKNIYIPTTLGAPKDVTCKDAGLPSPQDLRPSGPNNYFRMPTTDDLQGPALADFLYKELKKTKVGVSSDNEVYGKGIADTFAARFKKLGGNIVARQDFDTKNTNDFRPFLQTSKSAGAEAIFFGGVTANKGCVIRSQMKGIFPNGEATPFLGGDGIAQDSTCVKDAGDNAVGIYGAVATVEAEKVPGAKAGIEAFKKAYPNKADYGSYTILAIDATNTMLAALQRAIKANNGTLPTDVVKMREAVRSELAKTKDFQGYTGTISFDANGDTSAKVVTIYESKSTDSSADWPYASATDFAKTPLT